MVSGAGPLSLRELPPAPVSLSGAGSAGWRQWEGPGVTVQTLEGLRVAEAEGRLDLRVSVN